MRSLQGCARFAAIAIVLFLAACAPVRVREDSATLRAQAERETQLAPQTAWSLHAHLGVSNGEDGGSGDLEWLQNGAAYDFIVRAPVTGKTWRLHGDERRATLEGLRDLPSSGSDASELLEREAGWHVPMDQLRFWARGLRAPQGKAALTFDAAGLPALIEQDGWKVEYRDWFDGPPPQLPRKVFATRGKYRVRLVVEHWQTP